MMEKIMKWVREFFKRKDVKEAEQKIVHAVVEKVEDAIQDAIADEPKAAKAAEVVEPTPANEQEAPKAKKPRKKRSPAKKAAAKKAK